MPCTSRCSFRRSCIVLIVIPEYSFSSRQIALLSSCFGHFKKFRRRRLFVIRVQWITSGWQSVPRSCRAIAKCSAYEFVLKRPALHHIGKHLRITEYHASQSDRIHPSQTHRRLRHVRQKILQVTVSSPNNNKFWEA